jgi:O-antigen/teichoic acid export membrane protein
LLLKKEWGERELAISLSYKNNLKSGGVWAFLGKFSTSFMTLFINAILARMLAAEDLGIYFLAFNLAIFGAYIGTFGFEQTVIRFVADGIGKNNLKNVSNIIKISLFGTTIGAVLVGFLYYYSSEWIARTVFQSVGLSSITTIVIFWIIANSYQILIGETFRGFQDIRFASIFGGVLSTTLFIIALVGITYFKWIPLTIHSTILLWVVSLGLSNVIGLVILANKIRILMKRTKNTQKQTVPIKKVFSTTISFLVITVSFYIINQCDLWIISGVGDDEDVAVYGAVAKLSLLMSMPLMILNSVVSPLIAEKYAQGEIKGLERTLRTVATLAFVPTLGLFLMFVSFGELILTFVFGSALFGSGALILSLLALKHLIIVLNGATSTVLAMSGKQKKLMKNTIWTGICSIVLSVGLGHLYNGVGVALGFLIPNIISQVHLYITTSKFLNIRANVDLFGTFHLLKDSLEKKKKANVLDI